MQQYSFISLIWLPVLLQCSLTSNFTCFHPNLLSSGSSRTSTRTSDSSIIVDETLLTPLVSQVVSHTAECHVRMFCFVTMDTSFNAHARTQQCWKRVANDQTPFNIFENKRNVESMLKQSLNFIQHQFNTIQHVSTRSTLLNAGGKPFQHRYSTKSNACWMQCWNRLPGPLYFCLPGPRQGYNDIIVSEQSVYCIKSRIIRFLDLICCCNVFILHPIVSSPVLTFSLKTL